MKKTTVNISYDEEKLNALTLYLEQKGMHTEDEIVKALDALYSKNVPAGVREFIDLRSGASAPQPTKSYRRQKSSVPSAVGKTVNEVSANEAN